MPRIATVVDKTRLVNVIAQAEANGPFTTRNELYEKSAELYGDGKVSPSVVYLRIKEWGINVKTPIGKRGRKDMGGNHGIRVPRADKFKSSVEKKSALAALRTDVAYFKDSKKYLPVVARVAEGSMKAAVKLKCLDCCAYDKEEVKHCVCTSCPLFLFRPFQGK